MNKEEMRQRLSNAYDMIQTLNCQPTRQNVEIILSVLSAIQEVYMALEEKNADS